VLKPGKLLHSVTDFFPRQPQLVKRLKVEPKLWAGAKPVTETQRRIGRDTALAVDDSGNAVYWHVDLACQLSRRNTEFLQLFGKVLARVNSEA
jgi:hypothetical protein